MKKPDPRYFFSRLFAIRASGGANDRRQGFDIARASVLASILLAIFGGLIIRAAIIQLWPPSGDALRRIASRQYEQHLELAPYRGPVLDRNGHPLAISLKKPSIAINPRVFTPNTPQLKQLSQILDLPREKILEIAEKKAYFAWLKRKVEPPAAARVDALSLKGLYLVNEASRLYPLQSVAAHLIGAVGSDNQGLMGIEKQFQSILASKASAVRPSKDARGRTILYSSDLAAPDLPGHSIQLTIDLAIQEIAEEALANGVKSARAKSGFAIVTDPHTGKLLALANFPTFDPNNVALAKPEHMRNFALLDLFEPGSIMKPFVVAAALEHKKSNPEELHNCENGVYRVGGVVFHDEHPASTLTTAEVIIRSSNIGIFKIAERLGKGGLFEALHKFGFSGGLSLPDSFPSSMTGHIASPSTWKPIRFANVAFGQGMTVTGLEMAMAYGAIANGGNLMRPTLVDRITSPSGDIVYAASPEATSHVISIETARQMRQILSRVVTDPHGTAHLAATIDYTTGGKTGTAEKVDPILKAYSSEKRVSSFAGFAPVADPYLVIYVMIDEPAVRPAYGGLLAGPVFSEIAERSLRYLNVAPDKVSKSAAVARGTERPQMRRAALKDGLNDKLPRKL